MSLALLFPGQGSQQPQMLPWLDARPEAAPALDALRRRLGDWRHADPSHLQANAIAQPLLTGVGLAAWQSLTGRLPAPAVVAGYSVGELAAFAAVDVFDTATALDLAACRAQAMDASVAGQDGGLLAVQGPQALQRAQASGLALAIRIGAEFVLVGGTSAELETWAEGWQAEGLRCTRLPIAIPSHTPAMAPAAAAFAQRLRSIALRPARRPVVCNFTGSASRSPADLSTALAGQIASTVRWDDCMEAIAERGVRCVLELGPGAALSAIWRERHPGIPARSVDEFNGPDGVASWVAQQLG